MTKFVLQLLDEFVEMLELFFEVVFGVKLQ